MRRILRFVLSFVFAAMIISAAYAQPPPTLLWSDPVNTNAIALSANGQYVVVGTLFEVRFYGRSSSAPLWTYHTEEEGDDDFTSVAISADGSYVVASASSVRFWANARSLTGNPDPNWSAGPLGGPIEHRCLAISDDGNYVAACGTGPNVFFWAGAAAKSGVDIPTTWNFFINGLVEAIAISDDGNHVAAVGFEGFPIEGVLVYWNNAKSLTGHPQPPTWSGQVLGENFVDVAISDDGNYVAVAAGLGPGTVYYWAGAITRTSTSEPYTWAGGVDVPFTSVDISCDGDSVIAGARVFATGTVEAGSGVSVAEAPADGPPGAVYFWGGARSLTDTPAPSWVFPTLHRVLDVAINDAGTYMAAVDSPIAADTLYFFNKQGSLLWQDVDISGDKLSISCDGGTLAVGTPAEVTAFLFDTGFSSPCCGAEAVGGVLAPQNTLSVLAPYIVAVGFAAIVATAVAVFVKKSRKARPA